MVLELRQQKKKESYSTDWRQTHKNMTKVTTAKNNNDDGNRYLYSLLLKINIKSEH